jgi:hypothetical protein
MTAEYEETECVDGDGEPYPEHDYPETGTECRRCGAECDDEPDEENDPMTETSRYSKPRTNLNFRPRLKGDERKRVAAEMRTKYEAPGGSLRSLAEEYDRPYGTVRRLLLEAGATLKPRPSRSGA